MVSAIVMYNVYTSMIFHHTWNIKRGLFKIEVHLIFSINFEVWVTEYSQYLRMIADLMYQC
jgi:hypothetical protein